MRLDARVSSDEQAERGTVENQVDFGEKYANLYQLGPIKWPKDDGITWILPLTSGLTAHLTYKGCQ
ncbi:MAG: hypothetical protein ABSA82_09680 [Thermacetogeniaceae bacterium]|jgi:site-specific DNA recombinase